MLSQSELQTKLLEERLKEIRRHCSISIGKIVLDMHHLLGISIDYFCSYFSEEIEEAKDIRKRSEDAIKKYAIRGIPKDFTKENLPRYIESIYQRFIEDEYISSEKKEDAKIIWRQYQEIIVPCIRLLFEGIELAEQQIKELGPYLSYDYMSYVALHLLAKRPCSTENSDLQKEIEFIQPALKKLLDKKTKKRKKAN